jgi:heat-inducible transcriptional repressor
VEGIVVCPGTLLLRVPEVARMQAAIDGKLVETLKAVVISYVRYGSPVGSRYVCNNYGIGLSPASVRGLMAELESLGLLAKPHTSAGRIPTERGYRLYVDRLLRPSPIKDEEAATVHETVDEARSVDDALERISRLLGSLSHHIGVAIGPTTQDAVIIRLETSPAGPYRLLITLATEPGRERTVSIGLGSEDALGVATGLLTKLAQPLVGKRLGEAQALVTRALGAYRGRGRLTRGLRSSLGYLLSWGSSRVHIFGAGNLVSEMADRDQARSLLDVLENREAIAKLFLSNGSRSGAIVSIGSENRCGPMRPCSVVSSRYRIGDTQGAVGVIGPIRMDYARVMALVDFASHELSTFLARKGGR